MYHAEFRRAVGIAYQVLQSLRKVAHVFGIAVSTVWRWRQASWVPASARQPRLLTQPLIDFVRAVASSDPFVTCATIRDKVREVFNTNVSRQLVGLARQRAGFTRVRARATHVPSMSIARQRQQLTEFATAWATYRRQGRPVIAIDETGF